MVRVNCCIYCCLRYVINYIMYIPTICGFDPVCLSEHSCYYCNETNTTKIIINMDINTLINILQEIINKYYGGKFHYVADRKLNIAYMETEELARTIKKIFKEQLEMRRKWLI